MPREPDTCALDAALWSNVVGPDPVAGWAAEDAAEHCRVTVEGRHLGRYRLLEPLGSGGMSVVYKGLDTSLQREVAVKVLHPHLAQHRDSRLRLAREARAVARLRHPNILEVFDFSDGETEDAFLVTELVHGETLKAFRGRVRIWPPEVGALIVHQISAALAHAHAAGVIHRDLKPENVMLRDDGVLKLMDFGIARVVDRDERMTLTGALVGSPAYMAPEVIEGLSATPESDVFALGTMLYWLWTGELPFSGPNTSATLKRILDGTYDDPREHASAVSDALLAILARCLARDPADRFAQAGELQESLGEALGSVGLEDPPALLAAFHADPDSARQHLVRTVSERLCVLADASLRDGRPARALGLVDHALALVPDHPEARAILESLQRARARRRAWKRTLRIAVPALALSGVLGVGLTHRAELRAALARPSPPAVSAHPTLPAAAPAATIFPAQPEAVPSPAPRPSGAARSHRAAAGVPIEILVRPYGHVQIDDGPRSAEALSAHAFALAPGTHHVRISCALCMDVQHTIQVTADGPRTFAFPARLKEARLLVDYQPPDAVVTIGSETRSAGSTLSHPFEILSPRAPTRFVHRVEVRIAHQGFRTEQRTVEVVPGQRQTVTGKLVAD